MKDDLRILALEADLERARMWAVTLEQQLAVAEENVRRLRYQVQIRDEHIDDLAGLASVPDMLDALDPEPQP
jgi:hypothetical protein